MFFESPFENAQRDAKTEHVLQNTLYRTRSARACSERGELRATALGGGTPTGIKETSLLLLAVALGVLLVHGVSP